MLVFVRRGLTVSCVFSALLMGLSFYAQDFLSILIYCVVVLVLFRLRSMVTRKLWAQRRSQQTTLAAAEVARSGVGRRDLERGSAAMEESLSR